MTKGEKSNFAIATLERLKIGPKINSYFWWAKIIFAVSVYRIAFEVDPCNMKVCVCVGKGYFLTKSNTLKNRKHKIKVKVEMKRMQIAAYYYSICNAYWVTYKDIAKTILI